MKSLVERMGTKMALMESQVLNIAYEAARTAQKLEVLVATRQEGTNEQAGKSSAGGKGTQTSPTDQTSLSHSENWTSLVASLAALYGLCTLVNIALYVPTILPKEEQKKRARRPGR